MQVERTADAGDVWTATVRGRVIVDALLAADPLVTAFGPDVHRRRLILDLSGVEWLDSAGIGWLVRHTARARQAGGRLVLVAVPPSVNNLLVVLKLDDHLALARDRDAALRLAAAASTP